MQFAFDILRATEAAAAAASEYVGAGDKERADFVATAAMRNVLNEIDSFGAQIVIGEGKKDNAPGLFEGEKVGKSETAWDIAVDPLDGTTQTAKGGPGAMSVIAVGGLNKLYATSDYYMLKIAYGPRLKKIMQKFQVDRARLFATLELEDMLYYIQSHFIGQTLTVSMLDRTRHAGCIDTFRKAGWRVRLIQDCDVSAAIATALPDSGVDLYYGIGGAPEGVIAAAAMKCLGGDHEGVVVDHKTLEPIDGKLLKTEDLASGDVIFCATGVTSGDLLQGVQPGRKTHSVLMYSVSQRTYWINASTAFNPA